MAILEINDKNNFYNYFNLIVVIIISEFLFDQYLNYRQLKKLNIYDVLPENLKLLDVDYENFKKSKIYSKEKMKFHILISILKLFLDLILMWIFYYPYLWNLSSEVISYFGFTDSEFKRIPLIMTFEIIRETIINLPISYYKDFYIEEKYGFNKKTRNLFIKDEFVSLGLSIVLINPITLGLVWVIEKGGKYFYIYVEIFVIFVILILITIYPNFIAPLFNTFTELEDGQLKDKINTLAKQVNFPLKKIFVIDGSKRSSHSNAYFFGLGNNKRIVLYDTLTKQMNDDEILAIICHELGHWQFGHMWKMMVNTLLQTFVMFYLYGYFNSNEDLFLSFGYSDMSIFMGIGIFMKLYSPISYFFGLVSLRFSRANEFQADSYAVDFKYGDNLFSGLIKLFKENSGDMDPDSLYASFHYTHPTLVERLNFIKSLVKKSE